MFQPWVTLQPSLGSFGSWGGVPLSLITWADPRMDADHPTFPPSPFSGGTAGHSGERGVEREQRWKTLWRCKQDRRKSEGRLMIIR